MNGFQPQRHIRIAEELVKDTGGQATPQTTKLQVPGLQGRGVEMRLEHRCS